MGGKYKVAVAGATGMVGREILKVLEERRFPVSEIKLLASERSEGKTLPFLGEDIPVDVLCEDSFRGFDIVLSSPGAGVSRRFTPCAVKAGCVVIDNTSTYRMEEDVPLVVPEVNPHRIKDHKGIIANPNCSTIQMVTALKPLHNAARIKRIVVSTYQAVSGAGREAYNRLAEETRGIREKINADNSPLLHQIAFNLIPHIDVFTDNYYTKEEIKMVNETKKIMEDDRINVTATCVRVPVFVCHAESLNIETEKKITREEAAEILSNAPGVTVIDNPSHNEYPLPVDCAGKDDVFAGRIREDTTVPNGLNLWIVSDNLRKGAALNAVQIAERLLHTE